MVTLTLDNRWLYVEGPPLQLAHRIVKSTSYLQSGFRYSKAFQAHAWDGRRKVITGMRDGRLRAPAGIAQEVADLLESDGEEYELVDNRKRPAYELGYAFNFDKLRPYQRDALKAACEPRGSLRSVGRGIVKMPPRSGKTLTAAAIIATLKVRALFVVPSTFLLHQSRKALQAALGVEVGAVGDDEWTVRDVTVATAQTLLARRGTNTRDDPPSAEYLSLIRQADLVIFDEIHHLSGSSEWRHVLDDSGAAYKLGLSATVFPDHEHECELGVIWLRASTGDLLIDLSISDLIEKGYLVETQVCMLPVREPNLQGRGWSKSLQNEAIYRNPGRNLQIVDAVQKLVAAGYKTVVLTNRLDQISALMQLLKSRTSIRAGRMVGLTDQSSRDRIVRDFQTGRLQVIVTTVMNEGVDIPEIEAVVVAEGGQDIKSTYQRLRCMTPNAGKSKAFVVDFLDLTHPYFAKHSLSRLQAYKAERAFKVKTSLYF